MTEGVGKWDCSGCGEKCSSFGALGNHARYSKTCTAEMRFWGKVDKSGGPESCWPYLGFIKWDGYGWVQYKRKFMTASRFAWIATHGEIADGMHVCHRCDNPRCCNPAHLWLGTHVQNMNDRTAKGRSCGSRKLHIGRVKPKRPKEVAL